ncbi:hypothetical protein ACX9R5_17355 [Rathayibacter sp. CAU 1779]
MSDSTRHDSDDADGRAASTDPHSIGDADENPTLPTVPLSSDAGSWASGQESEPSGSGGHSSQDADTERLGTAPLITPAGTPLTGSTPGAGTQGAEARDAGARGTEAPGWVDSSTASAATTPMDTLLGMGSAADAGAPARPRVRSGAIAWGLIVILASAALIALTAVPAAARWFEDWTNSLTPAGFAVVAVVVVGAFVLLLAGLSAIRGAQRRAAERSR